MVWARWCHSGIILLLFQCLSPSPGPLLFLGDPHPESFDFFSCRFHLQVCSNIIPKPSQHENHVKVGKHQFAAGDDTYLDLHFFLVFILEWNFKVHNLLWKKLDIHCNIYEHPLHRFVDSLGVSGRDCVVMAMHETELDISCESCDYIWAILAAVAWLKDDKGCLIVKNCPDQAGCRDGWQRATRPPCQFLHGAQLLQSEHEVGGRNGWNATRGVFALFSLAYRVLPRSL